MEIIKEFFSVFVTIGGWCVMLGVYITKIKQHDKEISEIKKRQESIDGLLMSINNTLTELSTKVDLLISDKIKK